MRKEPIRSSSYLPDFKKRTFSSGDVARLIGVSLRTAARMMIDEDEINEERDLHGKIPCFRLPNGGYRRVTRANLIEFLRKTGQIDALREIGEPQ